MKCMWPGCNEVMDQSRKRCEEHARVHHIRETMRQRQVRHADLIWHSRACTYCGAMFLPAQTSMAGPPRKKCPTCWGVKPAPKPILPCDRCGCHLSIRRKYCDVCRVISEKESRDRSKPAPKPFNHCTHCGADTRNTICTSCMRRSRRREQARLRNFRDRLFQSIVHSPVDVEFILKLLDSPCMYCGSTDEITIEHIVPLMRGGQHSIINLGPACRSCNCSKQSKTLDEWEPNPTPPGRYS